VLHTRRVRRVEPPTPVSLFVGRRRELAALSSLVGAHRLVSLVGPGGAGKTRLVVHWIAGEAPEVAGFVDLGPLRDPTLLALTVSRGCGLRDEPGVDPVEQLCQRFASSSLDRPVLVLDTCEHLRASVAALADELLGRCPSLRVLATSRVALGLPGEAVLPVGGLGPDAVPLFLDRARLVQPALGSGAEECARGICALADELPLGVELAAAHARALSLPAILASMSDRLGFLRRAAPVAASRHASLAASIEWSYELVDEPARRVLRALSVLPGPFTLEAAHGVVGGPATAALEALVDHSLVQFDAADERYQLLDTIREFADRPLRAAGEAEATEGRLLDWVAGLAEAVRPCLDRGDVEALRRVERDADGVRAALEVALRTGRGLDLAARIVTALAFFWFLRGQCAEGRAWADRVLAALDDPPCGLRWAAAFQAGYAGDLTASARGARVAAEAAQRVGDQRIRGRALLVAGINEVLVNDASGVPALVEAVELATRAGDSWARVEALQVLAYADLIRCDHRQAVRHADSSIATLDELGHPQLRAWDAAIRAEASALVGRFDEAVVLGRRAIELATAVGEPVSAASAVRPLAAALCQLGRVEECAAELAGLAPFFVEHPGLGNRAMAGIGAATVAVWRRAGAAVAEVEAVYEAVRASEILMAIGEAGALLALARLASGDTERAAATATEVITEVEPIEAVGSVCAARLVWCAAQRQRGTGDSPEVASVAHRALADASGRELVPVVADAVDVLAGLAVDRERWEVAARLHAAATRLRTELASVPSPLVSLFRPADERAVAERLGPAELARAHAQGATLDAVSVIGYAARSRGPRSRPRSGWGSLTPTEHDVVTLTATGLTNRDIAAQLLVSEGTVRTHLRSVFAKLGLRSRAELAAEATRRGS
jgi:predicted ATPase/DNA-binding CsgD family transcriptional regulator